MPEKDAHDMAGKLLRYLLTWQDAKGAFHGVHTHPVWRLHPGLLEDHYTGYSAWGAPVLIGLADILTSTGHSRVEDVTRSFLRYLLATQQPDDSWDNAGAEFGRCFNASCVDNMLQDLSLSYFAGRLRERLPPSIFTEIGERVARNLRKFRLSDDHIRTHDHIVCGTVNQDCAGIWAMYEWMNTFGWDSGLEASLRLALDRHLEKHLVCGVPDSDCGGMLRSDGPPDYIEPAEYYGVIVPAFLWAYRRTDDSRYLEAAGKMVRHVIRNSWRDHQQCRRLHRSCDRIKGEWKVSHSPMLISGGGLFLRTLQDYLAIRPDTEASTFIDALIHTCRFYQNDYGYITQASGWHDDFDVIVGTVWECHDLAFFGRQVRDPAAFIRAFESPSPALALTLGWNDAWAENDRQWAILRPFSFGFGSVGAKTADYGFPSIPAWCGYRHPSMTLDPQVEIRLVDDTFVIRAPGYAVIAVNSIYNKPWIRES
ncbi:MAG: hypothetical protein HY343_04140 [Lentisphaerae bacterium]|nr:hypothetical protein [Lentisphaerota bacterium]